ncbi:putative bifunctional diguanylate cyclase/phosphodiesterase [Neptuniibacter sp. QD48_55]|uniref:putative bifunctional diguanylate cyclase/phosphodiesterase n=1 Tax=Neptuniibacter sp. QD48_55 TaxID=3398212 RepID=UPI0039F4F7F2
MNLNKRASFLILPIIFVSYALAALVAYEQQSQSIQKLEQHKLNLRLSALHSEFSTYDRFLDAYLVSLLEGETLENFIRDTSNIYRDRMLTNNLESAIERYFNNLTEFISLAVLDENDDVLFYIENSTDPFSTIRDEQLRLAENIQEEKKLNIWEHHFQSHGTIMQQGIAIDSRTLTTPLIVQLEDTYKVIIAAKPSAFDTLLKEVQQEFQAIVVFTDKYNQPQANKLYANIQLKSNYYLGITPSPSYLGNLLANLKQRLLFIVILGSLITFTLLQLLIRKFITAPISQLDQQLTEITTHERQNIDAPQSDDEIGRLGRKFHNLYEQLHQSYQKSHQQSRTDALTQLPNRAAFYETASHQIAEAEKSESVISLIYLDLDNFKFVNDKYGHEVGDKLLQAVALRLNNIINITAKKFDAELPQAFRLSGDEFIVLLPNVSTEQALKLCEKILHLFADGYHFELGHFPVTASIGLATYPQDGHTLSQLISNADLAMYQAKKSGKNKQAVYSKELAKRDRQRKEIETKLKNLNPDKEFTLNYMPIINQDGSIKGCEALLRWHSKELGFVPPDLFIPIAESTGIFEKIDLWVACKALNDLPELGELFGEQFELSINISSAEIGSERFIKTLKKLSTNTQIPLNKIILEITETFALNQEQNALGWLSELQKLGFQIAIDDFGTGYTSLMQMVDYPVDIIKFDRELVNRITLPEKQTLAKGLVDLCHFQEITVVAEGVETEEQHNLLIEAGCDFQQGYYIAKPMPISDLEQWFTEYQNS